jgi:hypothetical protein
MKLFRFVRGLAVSGAFVTALLACGSSDTSPAGQAGGGGTPASGGSGGAAPTGGSGGVAGNGGSSGAVSKGGSAGAGGTIDGGGGCDPCMTTSCATQLAACDANTDCAAIRTCYDGCTDDACMANCYDQHPAGQSLEDAIGTCACSSCKTPCENDYSCDTDPCWSCADKSCAAQVAACNANADCAALQNCYNSCTDDACMKNCYDKYPNGQPLDDAITTCACASCATQCASWGC